MPNGRIPRLFAPFNAFINSTTDYSLAMSGGATNWSRLGITGPEINAWIVYRTNWNELYAKYINLDLRTKLVKDDMKTLLQSFTLFAQPILDRISGAAQATNADYEAYHIKRGILQDKTRTRFRAPESTPVVLSIMNMVPMHHTIRYKDSVLLTRGKPPGVVHCQIKYIVRDLDNPPDSVDDCVLEKISAKTPATILHVSGSSGKAAFYFLRWVNENGEVGGWSATYHAMVE